MHHAGHRIIHSSSPTGPSSSSPGLSAVIGMKGNGPERGRKETFLHFYLLTPTVSGANAAHAPTPGRTHPHACMHARTHKHTHARVVYLLQDDGRNNIGLIVKHIKGKTHLA